MNEVKFDLGIASETEIIEAILQIFPYAQREEIEEYVLAWGSSHFVCPRVDDKIIATAALMHSDECDGLMTGWESVVRKPFVYIGYLGVLPEFRGQHVASRLLKAILDVLSSWGLEAVIAEVRETNLPSIRLFKQAGFELMEIRQILPEEAEILPPGETSMCLFVKDFGASEATTSHA